MKVTTHWTNDDILVTDEVRITTALEEITLTADQAEDLARRLINAASVSRVPRD